MQLIRLSHCIYHCEYHLVIVTKYRRKIFNSGIFAYFDKQLAEIIKVLDYPKFDFSNEQKSSFINILLFINIIYV